MATTARAVSVAPIVGPGRGSRIALRVLQGALAVFFLLAAAVPKLIGEATAVQAFDDIGLGQWFRYLVGALELAGAVGLVVPRLARPAALGLAAVMVGAIFTNLFVIDGGPLTLTPAILLVLLLVVARGRRPRTVG